MLKDQLNYKIYLAFFLISNIFCSYSNQTGLTYILNGGRFGDCLLSYCLAKWVSYKYNIPLYYIPFKYSDQLLLHQKEKLLDYDTHLSFANKIYVDEINILKTEQNNSTLFHIPYCPDCPLEQIFPTPYKVLFNINWNDEKFINELKELIKPLHKLPQFNLPENCITVAVHIRCGSHQDTENLKYILPLKLPPHSFYIEQIKTLTKIFKNQKLYVHIFTDHDNPREIMLKYEHELNNNPLIQFGCRPQGNHHDSNVIEDFFALTKFDCLIRSESNFASIASKLAKYRVLIYPLSYQQIDNEIIIDAVKIVYGHKY